MQVFWHTCSSTNSFHSCPAALPAASSLGCLGAGAVNTAKLFGNDMETLSSTHVLDAVGSPYDLS